MPGSVFAWGLNDSGQLGVGNLNTALSPVQVHGIGGAGQLQYIKAVSASRQSLALRSNGTVVGWGDNEEGEVGDGTNVLKTTPVEVKVGPGLENIKTISAGRLTWKTAEHSLAVRADGRVFAWGANESGQLGNDSNISSNIPVQVHGVNNAGMLSHIVEVSGGAATSLAVSSIGKVYAWGDNTAGQIGDGTKIPRKFPVHVKGVGGADLLSNIKAVSGSFHSLALASDGEVYAWGENAQGQLGDGTNTPSTTPVQVKNLDGVLAISAGYQHSLALRWDGTVFAWGNNEKGQLGNGNNTPSTTPLQVKGVKGVGSLSNIVAVSAGYDASCALGADGEVYTWGDNTFGELGNGTIIPSTTPVQVPQLSGIVAVSMGTHYVLALW